MTPEAVAVIVLSVLAVWLMWHWSRQARAHAARETADERALSAEYGSDWRQMVPRGYQVPTQPIGSHHMPIQRAGRPIR